MQRIARWQVLVWIWLSLSAPAVAGPDLLLLTKYRPGMDIAGWYMSEKLDGVRAYWNGRDLLSREGNRFAAPDWFTAGFPPFELDGELWIDRNLFSEVQSVTSRNRPHEGWRKVTYNIFEVPNAPGGLAERLQRLSQFLEDRPHTPIRIIPQVPCRDRAHLEQTLSEIDAMGGEGVVLRNPDTSYETGRSPNALKVKTFDDMEAVVIGYKPGKGKYTGLVGALEVRLDNGKIFYLGSGLSDTDRKQPPAIGDIVVFRHHGFTVNGIPRFASYWRVKNTSVTPQPADSP